MSSIDRDESDIRQIICDCEAAWNRNDSNAFAAPFTEDADFIEVLGGHHRGRSVIAAGHRQIFDTIYRGSQITYILEQLRFLSPDIAIAFLHAKLTCYLAGQIDDPKRQQQIGTELRIEYARPTMVLSKISGRWQIVAFQNTRIAQPTSA